ncbi:cytochrome C oxidase subunit IV family protein [Rhizobacter fulvus]
MADPRDDATHRFPPALRGVLLAWSALLALLLCSLGSATLRLGALNAVAGIGIAVLKSAIVVWLFMRLHHARPLTRLVAATGLATLAVLATLAGMDYATRATDAAAVQAPRQLQPLRERSTTTP